MSDSIKTFKTGYILLPVLIGLSVVGWLFYREFNPELFSGIRFSWRLVGGLLLAVLFMFGRDGGLMWRFRFITDRELTWRQAFRVNMLCEFTSAVTPSAVGGSSLIVLFLNKEGINAGRSTALTISCLFLDELFLVLACPFALLLFSFDDLFGNVAILSSGIEVLFFLVYGVVTILDFSVISCIVPPSGMGKTFVAHYFPLATASPLAQGHRNTYGQSGIKFQRDESEVFYLLVESFWDYLLGLDFTLSGSQCFADSLYHFGQPTVGFCASADSMGSDDYQPYSRWKRSKRIYVS